MVVFQRIVGATSGSAALASLPKCAPDSHQDILRLYGWMRTARSIDEMEQELVARGELPVIRLGRRIVVPKAALFQMVGLSSEPN